MGRLFKISYYRHAEDNESIHVAILSSILTPNCLTRTTPICWLTRRLTIQKIMLCDSIQTGYQTSGF